jgi:hypothetical protein
MNVSEIIAGDSLQFTTSVPDYPASDGYTLKYRLVPRSAGTAIVITATASGDDFAIDVAASTTATWGAGEYSWHAYVEDGSARFTVGTGQLTIKPNPATMAAGTDTRTLAAKALDDLKAALAAWTPTRKSYQIGDVAMTFNTTADIVQMIEFWSRQVQAEKAAQSLAGGRLNPNKIFVRSGRA